MRSADATAVIAAALRNDTDLLADLLGKLTVEDVARITNAGKLVEQTAVRELTARLDETGRTS